jgi:uncharacterized protein with HEPN domain
VTHEIQIIGDAANNLSQATRTAIALPWRDIIAMRNRIVHDYGNIDPKRVWDVARSDLDEVIKIIEAHLQPPPAS